MEEETFLHKFLIKLGKSFLQYKEALKVDGYDNLSSLKVLLSRKKEFEKFVGRKGHRFAIEVKIKELEEREDEENVEKGEEFDLAVPEPEHVGEEFQKFVFEQKGPKIKIIGGKAHLEKMKGGMDEMEHREQPLC